MLLYALAFIALIAAVIVAALVRYRFPHLPIKKELSIGYLMYVKVDLNEPVRGFFEGIFGKRRIYLFEQEREIFYLNKNKYSQHFRLNDLELAERAQCYKVELEYKSLLLGGKSPARLLSVELVNSPPFIWK
jgi:hypothetical protein